MKTLKEEYLGLFRRFRHLKELARVNLDVLSLSIDVENVPDAKAELEKVQQLVQALMNEEAAGYLNQELYRNVCDDVAKQKMSVDGANRKMWGDGGDTTDSDEQDETPASESDITGCWNCGLKDVESLHEHLFQLTQFFSEQEVLDAFGALLERSLKYSKQEYNDNPSKMLVFMTTCGDLDSALATSSEKSQSYRDMMQKFNDATVHVNDSCKEKIDNNCDIDSMVRNVLAEVKSGNHVDAKTKKVLKRIKKGVVQKKDSTYLSVDTYPDDDLKEKVPDDVDMAGTTIINSENDDVIWEGGETGVAGSYMLVEVNGQVDDGDDNDEIQAISMQETSEMSDDDDDLEIGVDPRKNIKKKNSYMCLEDNGQVDDGDDNDEIQVWEGERTGVVGSYCVEDNGQVDDGDDNDEIQAISMQETSEMSDDDDLEIGVDPRKNIKKNNSYMCVEDNVQVDDGDDNDEIQAISMQETSEMSDHDDLEIGVDPTKSVKKNSISIISGKDVHYQLQVIQEQAMLADTNVDEEFMITTSLGDSHNNVNADNSDSQSTSSRKATCGSPVLIDDDDLLPMMTSVGTSTTQDRIIMPKIKRKRVYQSRKKVPKKSIYEEFGIPRDKDLPDDVMIKCNVCDKDFNDGPKFRHHLRKHKKEMEGQKPTPTFMLCTICGRSVKSSWIKQHYTIHERKEKKEYVPCPVCGKEFLAGVHLKSHMRCHSMEKSYLCHLCGKSFRKQSSSRAHMLAIHGNAKSKSKSKPCEVCGKVFSNDNNLRRHLRMHTGDKPYKCSICNKAFYTSDNRNAHQKRHSLSRPYQCTICNLGFTSLGWLNMHKTREHSGACVTVVNSVGKKKVNYHCGTCGKVFISRQNLERHNRVLHLGQRECIECEVCGKVCSSKSVLKTHMWIHSTVKPFHCEICGRGFNDKRSCKNHTRKCFKEEDIAASSIL